jgi:2-iminobutanoate/2-iminopropanoate deaminase
MLDKKIFSSENAPAAVGPYSMGVKTGNLVFLSGQLGLNPVTGEFVEGGIVEQTRQSYQQLKCPRFRKMEELRLRQSLF